MILYSAKSTIDAEGRNAFRVTKFADGEVESSYLTTHATCDCPAGVRPTCRHRQMLPAMISSGIVNTHWFLDWDLDKVICDFAGTPKALVEAVVGLDDSPTAAEEVDLSDPAGEALQGTLPLYDQVDDLDMTIDVTPAIPSLATWRRI